MHPSPVSEITERRDMGLYEVPLFMCGVMLVFLLFILSVVHILIPRTCLSYIVDGKLLFFNLFFINMWRYMDNLTTYVKE